MWSRSRSILAVVLGAVMALGASACGRGNGSPTPPSAASSSRQPAGSPSSSLAKPPDALAEGARVYEQYCQLCHAKDATGYAADNAPSLVSKTYLESASDELIAAGIRMGRPGTAMAAYGKVRGGPLEERQISALVGFLRSKGPSSRALPAASTSGDPKLGELVFEKSCKTCHGDQASRGNALNLHNPELLAAASPAFLRYAIVNGRPPTPMPAFQGQLTDKDIDDVVAWIWGFRPAQPAPPVANLTVPDNLPMVINPKGSRPKFTLRQDRFVSVEQVKKALDAKQRMVIIDARAPSDWIQFHIPGAISIPYHDRTHLERAPKDGTWILAYCACPHHASGEVVDSLRALKYPNTAVIDEGILFWKDQGFPLAGEAVPKVGFFPKVSAKPAASAPSGSVLPFPAPHKH